jgi:osmotically-inducible protein OsmY
MRKNNLKRFGPSRMVMIILAVFLLLPLTQRSIILAQEQQGQIPDNKIVIALEEALRLEQGIQAQLIDVASDNGIVNLSGMVYNMMAKNRATKVAESIRGVRAVINTIEVVPEFRPDSNILVSVQDALHNDPATDPYDIEVDVTDGIVSLSGDVNSWQERELAGNVAAGVRGVKDVVNDVKINYVETRTDTEIKEAIQSRLKADVWTNAELIKVGVNNGNVELSGTVGSAAERRWAAWDSWVEGTKSVDTSALEIDSWADTREQRTGGYKNITDAEIEKAVETALKYDPRVNAFNVKAKSGDAVVTLTGTVNNLRAKNSAQHDAENTVAVWRVKNHIKVRPEIIPPNDSLENKVVSALHRDPYEEAFNIDVSAVNGVVYLNGRVNTAFERKHAAEVAGGINGVVDVINLLNFAPVTANKSDQELKQDVMDQLYWNPYVQEDQINVKVEDGKVILSGDVNSRVESDAAESSAYKAGAKDVWNRITVNSKNPFSLSEEE